MKRVSALLLLLAIAASPKTALAGMPALSNLALNAVDGVLETFSAALAFKPVEPASTYGKYWGISAGVIVDAASTAKLKSVVPATSKGYLPSGDIFLGLQAPLGLGAEFGILPSVHSGGLSFRKFGGDLKWTINKAVMPKLPLDIALRLMSTSTSLSYTETISGVTDTIKFGSTVSGANLSVSKRLLILEPYIGAGAIKQTGTLSNSGLIQLFNTSVTLNNSYSHTTSSFWLTGGFQIRLLVPTISAEYDRMFGINTYAIKLGLKI